MDPRPVESVRRERRRLLVQMQRVVEPIMLVLAVAWLALLVVELTRGLPPQLQAAGTAIWIAFVGDFLLRLLLAPEKGVFLRGNLLMIVSLALPAVRVARTARALRLLRAARVGRGLRMAKLLSSLNRGMRSLRRTMSRRGLGYVGLLTLMVTVVGAAGMNAFERHEGDRAAFGSFASSLWWTAMLMTTMGPVAWPRTPEGRLLCLLLALYAFAIFGYITASLTSWFVGNDQTRRR